ncbi:2,3,4,5-tetrahydropyridine-2,6-dicarboxylate N-acetyltransferase [bacterium HR24]|nr:2,3,4,5-tetrahydropyridine-2,6-dicarboxylate N-acetyltransferase [bacterium HR24]
MGPLSWLADVRNYLLLRHYVRQGLRLGRDVRIMGKPDFGSEPYLIEIGDHVTISSRVTFVTHDGATWVFRHLPQYRGLQRFGRIVIEDNCFIGTGAIILPGVRIGPNAVVAAGAVVTRSVPPDTVVAGVPARPVCTYDEYVRRSAPRCRHYPPEVTSNRRRLRRVLLDTLPYPTWGPGEE